jgi:hypothetical protein
MTLKEKFEDIEHLGLYKDEYSLPVWSTKVLDNQASQCEKIADEFAIGFAEWAIYYSFNGMYSDDVKELLEIYKKEKGL